MKKLLTMRDAAKFTCASLLLAGANAWAEDEPATQTTIEARSETGEITLPGGQTVEIETSSTVTLKEPPKKAPPPPPRKTLLFTRNNAGEEFQGAITRMQTQIQAQASGREFEFINYEDAIKALKALPEPLPTADGVEQMFKEMGLQEKMKALVGNTGKPAAGAKGGATQDQLFDANNSMVSIAEHLDADYIVILSLDDFEGVDKVRGYEKDIVTTTTHTLTASYVVMDYLAASIGGNTLSVENSVRWRDPNTRPQTGKFGGGLDTKMAKAVADEMKKRAKEWRVASQATDRVPVYFNCIAFDLNNAPIYLPRYDEGKGQMVLNEMVPAYMEALVEVDGVAVGTTSPDPSAIFLTPRLHNLRMTRAGYDDVIMKIKPHDGFMLTVPMRAGEGEINKMKEWINQAAAWTKDMGAFEAEAEIAKGMAEMLRNSGIQISHKTDMKSDVKVEADKFPDVIKNIIKK